MWRRRAAPITLGLGLMLTIAGCGSDDCDPDYSGDCAFGTPVDEVSFGLVAGDFNGTGRTSVIQTSIIAGSNFSSAYVYGNYPYGTGSYLKSYQSTGPGAYAAPVLIGHGHNPLHLAAADFNGDHLPDVVSASFDDGAIALFLNYGPPASWGTNLIAIASPQGAAGLAYPLKARGIAARVAYHCRDG
jgi:hypothetical protein